MQPVKTRDYLKILNYLGIQLTPKQIYGKIKKGAIPYAEKDRRSIVKSRYNNTTSKELKK